jgi:phage shock protein A
MSDQPERDEYNILDLEPEDAKEYVVAVMATLKQTTAKRIQLERDLERWQKRVELAVEKGRQDLVEGASKRAANIKEDIAKLLGEEQEYKLGVERMRAQLRQMQNRPKMSVDVDLLTAQMDMLVGEQDKQDAETKEQFKKAEADIALEELKRRMGNGEPGKKNE